MTALTDSKKKTGSAEALQIADELRGKKKRIYFYDLLKSISIYLICFYHFGSLNINFIKFPQTTVYLNYFLQGISGIGAPIFFMVNGALLLNNECYLNRHIRKIVTISLLYLIWGAITLIVIAPMFGDHYSVPGFIKAIWYTSEGRTNHLWFLVAIIYIYVLFPLIKSLYDKNEKIYSYYLLAVVFLFTFGIVFLNDLLDIAGYFSNTNALKNKQISQLVWFNPFNLSFSYSLVYFICGGWITKYLKNVNLKTITCISLFLTAACLLFLFGVMKTNVTGKVYDNVFDGYDSIMTLTMSITAFMLCSKIKIQNQNFRKVITLIGANTLGIYLIHVPIAYWLTSYYLRLSVSKYLVSDLGYAFFILFLSLGATLLLKKIPVLGKLVRI